MARPSQADIDASLKSAYDSSAAQKANAAQNAQVATDAHAEPAPLPPRGGMPTKVLSQQTNADPAKQSLLAEIAGYAERAALVLEPAAVSALTYILENEGLTPALAAAVVASIPALLEDAKAAVDALGGTSSSDETDDAEMGTAESQARLLEAEKFGGATTS